MNKKKIHYKNIESLQPVKTILTEADEALRTPPRTIATSAIPEILGAVAGAVGGGAAGYAALGALGVAGYGAAGLTSGLAAAGGLVGGGMAAGVSVLAAPAVVLAVGGYALLSHRNKKKLIEAKVAIYQEIIRKQNALISELRNTASKLDERSRYLQSLIDVLAKSKEYIYEDLMKSGINLDDSSDIHS